MKALQLSRSIVRSLVAMALVGLLLWPAVATAQSQPSLAEIARQEAERRKTVKDAKRVVTAKDFPESARRPASTPGTTEGAAASQAGGDQKSAATGDTPSSGQGDEASWRGRITRAREGLARNEAFVAALQSQINGLTTDFVNRDDPYQRAKIGEDRQKALDELQRVKADVELSKKQIADIEEEARKAGVPPGWLR